MSTAIDELKHDHEAIVYALGILDRMGELAAGAGPAAKGEGSKGEGFNAGEALELVGFLKEFADTCHHGKEETILFPALVQAGIPDKGGPVGAMLQEHDLGRRLMRSMTAALSPTVKAAEFARVAAEYSAFLRQHIDKENGVLFPMGERLLAPARLEDIHARFQEHEEKVIGAGRHEELHAMLGKFGQKYGLS